MTDKNELDKSTERLKQLLQEKNGDDASLLGFSFETYFETLKTITNAEVLDFTSKKLQEKMAEIDNADQYSQEGLCVRVNMMNLGMAVMTESFTGQENIEDKNKIFQELREDLEPFIAYEEKKKQQQKPLWN